MEMDLRSLKAETTEMVTSHAPEKGADISRWNSETAHELAGMFDKVAVQMFGQADALGKQADSLRRMNKAIIAVREAAVDEG